MAKLILVMYALAASLASVGLGLDVGMISSTLVQPRFLAYFDNPSPSKIGGVVSVFSAGGGIGALFCPYLADPFGRLWAFRIGAVTAVIGAALQAGAVHIGMLIVGRLVNGLGAGVLLAILPIYLSEVAPPNIRGMIGGFTMLAINVGIFLATATGYGFGTHFTTDVQWRGPLAVQIIPVFLLIPISIIIPESPRWLVQVNDKVKAIKVLRILHDISDNDTTAEEEYRIIEEQITAEKEAFQATWMEIIKRSSWRRRLIIAGLLQTVGQFSGVNCIQYYAATIYEQLGFSHQEALNLNFIYGASGVIFCLVWLGFIDQFKRVTLLITCTLMMALAVMIQAILSGIYANATVVNANASRAEIAMFFVFNLFLAANGMLLWIIPPEMSPMAIRAKVASFSVAVNWIAGLVVALVSPIALKAVAFRYFYVFVAVPVIGAVIYYFYIPETSQLALEEIDTKFGDQIIDHNGGKDITDHVETKN